MPRAQVTEGSSLSPSLNQGSSSYNFKPFLVLSWLELCVVKSGYGYGLIEAEMRVSWCSPSGFPIRKSKSQFKTVACFILWIIVFFFFQNWILDYQSSFCKVCEFWFDHNVLVISRVSPFLFLNLFGEFWCTNFDLQVSNCKTHQFGLINAEMWVSFDSVCLVLFLFLLFSILLTKKMSSFIYIYLNFLFICEVLLGVMFFYLPPSFWEADKISLDDLKV